MIKGGYVTVCGGSKVAKPAAKLRGGDGIQVRLPAAPGCKNILAEQIPISIIHEDEAVIVLNKQAGLTVHPWSKNCTGGTMVNAIAWHFQNSPASASLSSVGGGASRPGIVHRLDRFTSGAICVAKSDLAHWRIAEQFAQRRTKKYYLAVVHGEVRADMQLIDAPLGRDPSNRGLMMVREGACGTASAGDTKYGGALVRKDLLLSHAGATHDEASPPDFVLKRQALHAAQLTISHPISNTSMTFDAPVAKDML
ncbi:pseudouridine synthase, partial [Baffinella frigidus]